MLMMSLWGSALALWIPLPVWLALLCGVIGGVGIGRLLPSERGGGC
jgi:hypothetical protein